MSAPRPAFPRIVRIELSSACNFNCPQCRHNRPGKVVVGRKDAEMSLQRLRAVISEAAPHKPSITLNVANEPLIAAHFLDAVRLVKEHGLTGTFNTNGLALTPELARELVGLAFDSVMVSVDALTPESYRAVRGKDCLADIVAHVELLLRERGGRAKPRIGVSFVDQPANHHELPGFLEFWRERVDVIKINGFIDDGARLPAGALPARRPCSQLFQDMVIRSDGDVSPCVICAVDPRLSLGNVFRDGGLAEVWNGTEVRRWRELHETGRWGELPSCRDCDYWADSCPMRDERRGGFLVRRASPFTVFYNVAERMGNWSQELLDRQGLRSRPAG